MIEIAENLKPGDLVYAWFSPFKEKNNKKPNEIEYRLGDGGENHLKLLALEDGYSIIFGKDLIETWHGAVRPVKK